MLQVVAYGDVSPRAFDSRSGALWNRPSDISTDLPDIHIECKDHETVKVKEWMRQAEAAASFTQKPVVAFRMEEEILTIMRLGDVLDLFVEIADLRTEVADLQKPVVIVDEASSMSESDTEATAGLIIAASKSQPARTTRYCLLDTSP